MHHRMSSGSLAHNSSSLMLEQDAPTWYHNLPITVLVEIFRHFELAELKNFMLVCQQWKYAAQNLALWKKLVIRGNQVPIYFISKKIRGWTKLESLCVDDILEPTTVIRQVCRCIPGIKHLAIRHCSPVPESAVRFIIKTCTDLESLDLSGTTIKGNLFYKELASLTKLKKLNLSSNPYLTTKNLITAVLNCRGLCDLRLSKYLCNTETLRDEDAIMIILSLTDNLTSLSFDCSTLSVSAYSVIFNCKKLQRLCLYGATNLYSGHFVSIHEQLPHLTQLKITNAHQIGDVEVKHLFEQGKQVMKNLTLLDLSGCWKLTSASLEVIVKVCTRLQKLSLKSCKSIQSLDAVSSSNLPLTLLNIAFMQQLNMETIFPLAAGLQVLLVDDNEKIMGWLKTMMEDVTAYKLYICLSEYNKTKKAIQI